MHPLIWPLVAGVASIAAPVWIMPEVPSGSAGYVMGAVLPWQLYRSIRSTLAILRWWQRRQPVSPVASVPDYDPKGITIGYGFRVTARHTQALEEQIRADGSLPVDRSELGGFPALHAVGGMVDTPVRIPWSELVGHVGLFGATRSGKTRALEVILASLMRGRERGPVIVIDPKGDAGLESRVTYEAAQTGRAYYRIRASDPAGSARLNPLATAKTTAEVAARIEVMMPAAGANPVAIFTEYPIALVEAVAGAHEAMHMPWSLSALAPPLLQRFLLDRLFGQYAQIKYGIGDGSERLGERQMTSLRELSATDTVVSGMLSVLQANPEYVAKMLAALVPALRGIQSGPFGEIFGGGDRDCASLDWAHIEREEAVVYIGLNNLLYGKAADSMSRLVLADVIGFVAQRYTAHAQLGAPISLVVDELAAAVYPGFIDALSQGGGAGLRVVISTQSLADLIQALGRPAATRMTSNLNTPIYLRLVDGETRKRVSEDFGSVNIAIPERSGAVTHSPERGAAIRVDGRKQYRPMPLISQEHLGALPRGQAYAKIQGQAYKIRVPLLPDVGAGDGPGSDLRPRSAGDTAG